MKSMIILTALVAAFSFSPASAAVNLAINGGFETGDFSGWEQFGDGSYSGVYSQADPLPVDDGQFSAAFGPSRGFGGITQTIDTVPGKAYDVSFHLANTETDMSNEIIFSFDDGFQVDIGGLDSFDFQTIELPVTASGTTADISFFFYNPVGYFLLDDVSVTPVPEPATWTMLLVGFAAIGATTRRRRQLLPA